MEGFQLHYLVLVGFEGGVNLGRKWPIHLTGQHYPYQVYQQFGVSLFFNDV